MIVVTGGFGFIGKRLVTKLLQVSKEKITIVEKIVIKSSLGYCKNDDFIKKLKNKKFSKKIKMIFHQGANSKTVEKNFNSIMKDNYLFTKDLIDECIVQKIPIIYASSASVYGVDTKNFDERSTLEPSNYYSLTKYLIDEYVTGLLKKNKKHKIIGLRYFNVFGPGEEKKGRMASVFFHFNKQIKEKGYIKLFKGENGYKNGEQKRDFVYVDDCADVNIWLSKNFKSGIYNVGSGHTNTFNNVAKNIFKLHEKKQIYKYIKMPNDLIGKYQNYTKANITKLRKAGYKKNFTTIGDAIKLYLK